MFDDGHKSKGLFITATNTGVGKTVVSSILAGRLLSDGADCVYYKPVQTGALKSDDGELYAPDCRFVNEVSGCRAIHGLLFTKPASPHLSAEVEMRDVTLNELTEPYLALAGKHDYILVEGAGGLYVPLDRKGTVISMFPAALSLPVVIVAPAGLGTINSVSLSVLYTRTLGLSVAAVILIHDGREPTDIEIDNRLVLQQLHGIDDVILVPAAYGVDTESCIGGNTREIMDLYPNTADIYRWFDA
jgi:dethiobiotin synthetase